MGCMWAGRGNHGSDGRSCPVRNRPHCEARRSNRAASLASFVRARALAAGGFVARLFTVLFLRTETRSPPLTPHQHARDGPRPLSDRAPDQRAPRCVRLGQAGAACCVRVGNTRTQHNTGSQPLRIHGSGVLRRAARVWRATSDRNTRAARISTAKPPRPRAPLSTPRPRRRGSAAPLPPSRRRGATRRTR